MKKWLYIIGGVALISIVGVVILWLNANRRYDNNNPLHYIPSSAVAVLKVNGAEKYLMSMGMSEYHNDIEFAEFDKVISSVIEKAYSTFSVAIQQPPSLGQRTLYISLHPSASNKADILLMSFPLNNYADGTSIISALEESEVTNATDTIVGGQSAVCIHSGKYNLYVAISNGCMFASLDASLLAEVIVEGKGTLHDDACFTTLERTSSPSAPVAAFVNMAALDSISLGCLSHRQLSQYGSWVEMDFDFSKQSLTTNGFMTSAGYSIVSALASHKPTRFNADDVIPSCAQMFISIAASPRGLADDAYVKYLNSSNLFDSYSARRKACIDKTGVDVEEHLSQVFSGEMALFSNSASLTDSANACLIVNASNGTIAQAALNSVICATHHIESARQVDVLSPVPSLGVPVYEGLDDSDDVFFLSDFLPYVPRRFYIRYENTLMIADNKATLKRALYETLLNRTFSNDADFRKFRSNFTDENVLFGYCSSSAMKEIVSSQGVAEASSVKNITNFYGFGVQVSSLSQLPYITACGFYEPGRVDMPPTLWQSKIDTTIVGKPYAVLNHNTGETEFFVQDASNSIYLVNASGLVLWNRKLDSPIVGDVVQIDYYNNKKLQYLFATRNCVHLIDRNGNNTAKFPIHLQSEAVGSVTYLDYGINSDFRVFVPCRDKKIALFDKNCKPVEGWEMKNTEGFVVNSIDHWISNNKDYLISKDDFRLYITDRRGNERVKLQPMAPNANSRVYVAKANSPEAAFVTSTADGKMARIDIASSSISTIEIDSIGGTDHYMFKLNGEDSFVFINNKNIVQTDDRGNVVSVKSIYLSSVDWATITSDNRLAVWDKNESLGYLFECNGRLVDGFPIPAKSPFAVSVKDESCNIIVAGDNGILNNYIK
ncbi:MAG: hypothetical protein MJZ13_06525 [Bacteroidales bacterium]|nr:hypothetical protein [Bacteroidales bacterium]